MGRNAPIAMVRYSRMVAMMPYLMCDFLRLYTMLPSHTAIGSCSQTGMTDCGKALKTEAMTTPKMATTIHSAKKIMIIKRFLTRALTMSPAMSPILRPSWRREITIEPKSCTAPMKMDPTRTQIRAGSHPQMRAMAGPTIGPVPAIDVKWWPNRTVLSVATKSMPSWCVLLGAFGHRVNAEYFPGKKAAVCIVCQHIKNEGDAGDE